MSHRTSGSRGWQYCFGLLCIWGKGHNGNKSVYKDFDESSALNQFGSSTQLPSSIRRSSSHLFGLYPGASRWACGCTWWTSGETSEIPQAIPRDQHTADYPFRGRIFYHWCLKRKMHLETMRENSQS